MRIVHELLLHISEDERQLQSFYERPQDLSKVTLDTFTKSASGPFSVIDGNTTNLTLGAVTSPARGLYLEVDAACDVLLSGSTDPIALRPAGSLAKIFLECEVTSIEVQANQGADVSGSYAVWGDEQP